MKKTTKGALAAVAGGSLLFGGAGSLAYWTGESTVTGDSIESGTLDLTHAGLHRRRARRHPRLAVRHLQRRVQPGLRHRRAG